MDPRWGENVLHNIKNNGKKRILGRLQSRKGKTDTAPAASVRLGLVARGCARSRDDSMAGGGGGVGCARAKGRFEWMGTTNATTTTTTTCRLPQNPHVQKPIRRNGASPAPAVRATQPKVRPRRGRYSAVAHLRPHPPTVDFFKNTRRGAVKLDQVTRTPSIRAWFNS
ncbi:uncharacterized protein LY79DRAFT_84893 [Colletotrichum navitas]|uniref:Uncharacterized protein n=1 Tax=Colletotrichum navitas TaxID=681940 RepID=A0AAD8UYB7_9PEZI|nr:uncharacterized protein LY79DRAFT_84893 [Colletotrichum navitas]KAK1569522.1 hypothetical protein LY79DRAFT_84893 [Colletotrichum navitas]